MAEEQILHTDFSQIMQKSYVDYAMSVIISRALPDIRDGLKPVQRRTLYDMYELGIQFDKPYRKCARIVGDTMGKYHPHGDSSIYDSLVVMAQDFKKAMPLVDGHGNFGSIEGDGAAAMRYTEARLQKVTQEEFLADLDKNVVDFMPNFDETEKEPTVLPVRLPNFLINGSEGIAVGMATSTPPHNLGEVIDAVKAYMKDDSMDTAALMKYIKGPDFPTGGIIVNKDDLQQIYETGSGRLRIRGKVEREKVKGGRERLVVTEIPYTMIGSGIGKFMSDVYSLVESKKTTDITDISNQSSKEGIRIVIDLRRNADVDNLLALLYKKTRLEDTFGVNMLAIADGRPETLSLKGILNRYLDFQFEICSRKYRTLLDKELEKQEIQEGLIRACDIIDLIIEILRGSKNLNQARACLTQGKTEGIRFKTKKSEKQAAKLNFTPAQANAILQMRLYRLIGLEIDALMAEHDKTMANIARYKDILENHDSMAAVILKELDKIKKNYSSPRRTAIINASAAVYEEKAPQEMDIAVLIDRFGYARTIDQSVLERNAESAAAENRYIISCKNTDRICIFTDSGRVHLVKTEDLPYGRFRDKGYPLDNFSGYDSSQENIIWAASLPDVISTKLIFVTREGLIKQVEGREFDASRRTISASKLGPEDRLLAVFDAASYSQVVLHSHAGAFIRFSLSTVPEMKKNSLGVRGIQLAEQDYLEDAWPLDPAVERTVTCKDKPVLLNKLRLAGRGGKGTKIRL